MALVERDLVVAPEAEASPAGESPREELIRGIDHLRRAVEGMPTETAPRLPRLVGVDGTELELPAHIFEVLLWVAERMAAGQGLTIASLDKELTTQQAATILNISRPYLVRLLERGDIPFRKVGTHRRVKLGDVLRYREERDMRTANLLHEMAEERDWGL